MTSVEQHVSDGEGQPAQCSRNARGVMSTSFTLVIDAERDRLEPMLVVGIVTVVEFGLPS